MNRAQNAPEESFVDKKSQLDPIEEALRELEQAEQARLFQPTRVDANQLVTASQDEGRVSRRVVRFWWSAVAAAVLLATGVSTWLFQAELSAVRDRSMLASREVTTIPGDCSDWSILGCVTGPSQLASAACGAHDYDTDGDVDLADFRAYQLACANHLR